MYIFEEVDVDVKQISCTLLSSALLYSLFSNYKNEIVYIKKEEERNLIGKKGK